MKIWSFQTQHCLLLLQSLCTSSLMRKPVSNKCPHHTVWYYLIYFFLSQVWLESTRISKSLCQDFKISEEIIELKESRPPLQNGSEQLQN
jgi:hypothetical protein